MRNKSSELIDYIELGIDSISLKCLKNMKTVYQDENNVVLYENSVFILIDSFHVLQTFQTD